MSVTIALLFLLLSVPAQAQDQTDAGAEHFSPAVAADVFSEALSFIGPRALKSYPLPTLALWGLSGLTTLDPALSVRASDGKLHLFAAARVIAITAEPPTRDPAAWGNATAVLVAAAWRASPDVRNAGQSGVFAAFFNELFDHFDPYSRYVSPEEAGRDRASRIGRVNVGIRLARSQGAVIIKSVHSGSAAAGAGIAPGMRVLAIDGVSTAGRPLALLEDALTGGPGTGVRLRLAKPGRGTWNVIFARRTVPPQTVFLRRQRDMLVLRISGFERATGPNFANELTAGLSGTDPPRGIVIDLRGNRGGLLDQAIYVANVLLPYGIVATTSGRAPGSSHIWYAGGADMANNLPVVVIVNGATASAAEIVAAAIADNGRGVVVGSATLGKGLVQAIEPLADGGALFLTWSRVLAPRGWPIQELGVLPEVCTSRGPLTLEHDLAQLADGIQPMAGALYAHETARAPLALTKVLAIRAACPAAIEGTGAMLAAQSLIDNPAAYAAALLPPLGQALALPEVQDRKRSPDGGRRG